MARTATIEKEKRRMQKVKRYAAKRAAVKATLSDINADDAQHEQAEKALQSMPRDASPVRRRYRCQQCGRPRGVYRKFGICRSCLRKATMNGDVPGLVKASW